MPRSGIRRSASRDWTGAPKARIGPARHGAPSHTVTEGEVEVFRAADERSARDRALVLRAKGIAYLHARDERGHALFVAEDDAPTALAELATYEDENRAFRPRPPLPPPMPGAGPGTA